MERVSSPQSVQLLQSFQDRLTEIESVEEDIVSKIASGVLHVDSARYALYCINNEIHMLKSRIKNFKTKGE